MDAGFEPQVELSERGFRRLCRTWRDPNDVDRAMAQEAPRALLLELAEEDPTKALIARMLLTEAVESFQDVASRLLCVWRQVRRISGRSGNMRLAVTSRKSAVASSPPMRLVSAPAPSLDPESDEALQGGRPTAARPCSGCCT